MTLQRTSPQGTRKREEDGWRRGRGRREETEAERRVRRKQEVVVSKLRAARPGEEQRLLLSALLLLLRTINYCWPRSWRKKGLALEQAITARIWHLNNCTIAITHAAVLIQHCSYCCLSSQLAQQLLTVCVAVIWWGTARWRGICTSRVE